MSYVEWGLASVTVGSTSGMSTSVVRVTGGKLDTGTRSPTTLAVGVGENHPCVPAARQCTVWCGAINRKRWARLLVSSPFHNRILLNCGHLHDRAAQNHQYRSSHRQQRRQLASGEHR